MVVLPMYMGVIPTVSLPLGFAVSAPHVYGGDPNNATPSFIPARCSPCIWG